MKVRNIEIPKHIKKGISHRKSGFPNRIRFFSGDVETYSGKPITLQLADNAKDGQLFWVNPETILPTFLEWIKPRILRKQVNVCFFHYLDHDLPALLYHYINEFRSSQFKIETENVTISVLAGKMFYAKIIYDDKTILHIIDTYRFYTTSLEKAGKALNCVNMKFKKPHGLGFKRFTPKDQDFVDYAMQDALLGWEIGKHIIQMHEEFDVPLSISAPQFAARVFCRYHMKPGERIPMPNKHVLRASLYSYHGGKNGFYVKPGKYSNVTELDISSAYPNAMKGLPQFIKGQYEYVNEYDPAFVGVYRITGTLKECRYSPFLTHEGKAIYGPCEIEKLWVTCYELQEALRTGEFILKEIAGWRWNPDIIYPNNPLSSYVDTFYKMKEECPKGNAAYLTYKLLLNGLYGKFIQNIEIGSEVQAEWFLNEDGTRSKVKHTFRAGGLFNPFIATLITGQVRAYLHRLEHQYKALHASTDSIKTLEQIDPAKLPKGLGGLNVEVTGDCVLIRNKLYLHFKDKVKDCKFSSFIKKYCKPETEYVYKCRPKKYALHGFWGQIEDLLSLIGKKENNYTIYHLYKVREALNQKLTPLKSYKQERRLEIDWKAYIDDVETMAKRREGKENQTEKVYEGIWIPRESDGSDRTKESRKEIPDR